MKANGSIKAAEIKREEAKKNAAPGSSHIFRRLTQNLIHIFYSLGYNVGTRPLYFIVIPIILSFILMTGVIFIDYEEDPIALFVPFNAPFIKEQTLVEKHFPMNYTHYYEPTRFTRHEGHSRVIITAKDGQSILRSILWPEIMDLDAKIKNNSIIDTDGSEKNFEDLCAKWKGECVENSALNINEIIGEVENGTTIINYPIMVIPFIVPQLLGGAVINKTAGRVMDAKAIMLSYTIAAETAEKNKRARIWEKKLLDYLKGVDYEHIKISYYTSRSLGDELKITMDSCLPYIPLTTFIMVASCIGLLWTSDCIRSKPLIGVIGIISSGMAAGASFGFLMYCGAGYTRLNVVALFLVLGIGVDDIFVAIAAWQKTSVNDPVPKRLAHTYADAAVAVTVTSLTNALSFAVGTTTPTLILQNFCLYCGVTIVFAYFWFITFCGAFLAIAGYMEEQGRHSLFLIKVKSPPPENASAPQKKFYDLFCSSKAIKREGNTNNEAQPHIVSLFFRDYVGELLMNNKVRALVAFSFLLYLIGAIYGCFVLKEGLYRHRMSRDDSYLVDFSLEDNLYFRHLPYSVQVIITGNITYSDPQTQKDLMQLERDFEALPHGGESLYTQSWLRGFLRRLRRKKDWKRNITDEESFIRVLRENYLFSDDNPQNLDIEFNENYTKILASRIILQAADVKDVYDDVVMMNNYRQLAAKSKFNVTCFHILFSLFDQHSMMKPLAIQSILIAIALVMVVALIFIPDAKGSLALAGSILSTAAGVIGYMAYWDINLDHVSAGSIFMCIGFSVDFSAHITYTYLSSKEKTIEGKIKDSMFSLGLPIVQGGLTTILSLITFLLIPGYGYRTFFKTIFLVTIFAAYHSIILIPLFLAMLDYIGETYKRTRILKSENKPAEKINNGIVKHGTKNGVLPNNFLVNGTYTKKDSDILPVSTINNQNNETKVFTGVIRSHSLKDSNFKNKSQIENLNKIYKSNGHIKKSKNDQLTVLENGLVNKAFVKE